MRSRVDWQALRLEYVNGTMTLRELADSHGIKAAGMMNRSAKEEWDAERKQRQAESSRAAQTSITIDRVAELVAFNEADLSVAKEARTKAKTMMETAVSATDLRAVVAALEAAQRIGRLALGATTDNSGLSDPNGDPLFLPTTIRLVAKVKDAAAPGGD